MKDYLYAAISWIGMFLAQLVLVLIGPVVVAVGLMFRKTYPSTEKHFTTFNTDRVWVYEDLPNWLKWYQNIEDGLRGDHRGWWDANCFGKDSSKLFNMFWWSAIRNPANYFKRFVIGCDIRQYSFVKLAGKDHVRDDFASTGFQIIKAVPKTEKVKVPRFMLYYVKRYGNSKRALVIQLGNKIKLEHNTAVEQDEYDYFKGFTFEVNPYKDIS